MARGSSRIPQLLVGLCHCCAHGGLERMGAMIDLREDHALRSEWLT